MRGGWRGTAAPEARHPFPYTGPTHSQATAGIRLGPIHGTIAAAVAIKESVASPASDAHVDIRRLNTDPFVNVVPVGKVTSGVVRGKRRDD